MTRQGGVAPSAVPAGRVLCTVEPSKAHTATIAEPAEHKIEVLKILERAGVR